MGFVAAARCVSRLCGWPRECAAAACAGRLSSASAHAATLWAGDVNRMSWGLTPAAPSSRTDLEKAVAAHGGQGVVAAALGWPLKVRHRRPKGYWDDLANVRAAIDDFIGEQGMEAGESPRLCARPCCQKRTHLRVHPLHHYKQAHGVRSISRRSSGAAAHALQHSSGSWHVLVRQQCGCAAQLNTSSGPALQV